MKGRRLPDITMDNYRGYDSLNLLPGDYRKYGKHWAVKAPNGDVGRLGTHTVVEHEDGSITVSPSIQFETGKRWHGYLEKGVWREV